MEKSNSKKPSSATDGFFQALPVVPPAYTFTHHPSTHRNPHAGSDDKAFARVLELYLPQNCSEVGISIDHLARRALQPSILALAVDAEINQPFVRPLTTFGEDNRVDPLWTSEGWRTLKTIGQEEGVVTVAYKNENERWNRRVHQFALNHVWSGSAAMTGCPASMSDGAVKLLKRHLEDPDGDQPGRAKVLEESYRRLLSQDPSVAWTSGQWMTERKGGSDVRETETVARRLTALEISQDEEQGRSHDTHGLPLGPWRIDGFKWFSSATDSDMSLILAQTTKGLSLFYIPMRRCSGKEKGSELNGIRIQRLKNKLGTKSLPTAELELKGVRGWLVGEEGKGVKEISTVLNITRLWTASGSSAGWSRALSICRAYSKVRRAQGILLQDNPQHVRWMAGVTVNYWAATHLTFFAIALQGAVEQDWDSMVRGTKASRLIPRDNTQAASLLRLITPVMKAVVTVNSVNGIRSCMECLGGVGYCENNEDGGLLNIAKIFRDTCVNAIWEGTGNVMAEDVVRVITDKRLGGGNLLRKVFGPWAREILTLCEPKFKVECSIVEQILDSLLKMTQCPDKAELLWRGRDILQHVEVIVCACLLMYDAGSNENEVAAEVASRWIRSNALPGTQFSARPSNRLHDSALDRKIFLGAPATFSHVEPSKL
ncbi:hypothetical protein ETB97_009390 [Aspergillus alliaceus]|uniref:Uncharacterized protein n=1 Tax=Petromyces alliaceus TaxID=209559 RepID=A0A8H6AB16_PETAA|nr:hypothetical protein ETB97_009390 [Aspergillus burnettii]